MNPFIALRDHAKEVYDTLSGNERIKERTRGLYDQVVNRGVKPSFPMLLKDPQNVTMDDLIASGFGVMPMAIKAYHGSPHLFDKFDMSKIGTGEGAQAYGHGLYMAESPDVAKTYAQTGAKNSSFDGGHQYEIQNGIMGPEYMINKVNFNTLLAGNRHRSDNFLDAEFNTVEDALDYLKKNKLIPDDPYIEKYGDPGYETTTVYSRPSNLYETSLEWPDPAREAADPMGPQHYLDWDRPLSEQPESVKELLNKSDYEYGKLLGGGKILNTESPMTASGAYGDLSRKLSGPGVTQVMGTGAGNSMGERMRLASAHLKELGIPGIRYLDQGSRGAGQGSYNYVVFDDSIPKIVKRNGKPVNTGLPPTQFSKAHETAQRNAALPVEQGGLGLPPDNTAMDRARAMGFDVEFQHGSPIGDILAFDLSNSQKNDPGYLGRAIYGSKLGTKAYTDGGNVYPLLANTKNMQYITPDNWNINSPYSELSNEFAKDFQNRNSVANKYTESKIASGISGIVDVSNGNGLDQIAIYDPTTIRSRFAAFDPFKRNSADILATGIMGSLLLNELKNRNAQDKPRYR